MFKDEVIVKRKSNFSVTIDLLKDFFFQNCIFTLSKSIMKYSVSERGLS